MNRVWQAISIITSICSIIGFPITLFQIWKVRSTTKVMERNIEKFIDLEEISTLNKIFDMILKQINLLVSTYNKTMKKGTSINKMKTECENSIKEINTCIANLPSEFSEIDILLGKSVEYLNEYIEKCESIKIKECENCLRIVITKFKKIKEKNRESELKAISK